MASDVMFSDKFLIFFIDKSDVDWVVFFHISSHFRTNISSGVLKGRQARHLPRAPLFVPSPLEVLRA